MSTTTFHSHVLSFCHSERSEESRCRSSTRDYSLPTRRSAKFWFPFPLGKGLGVRLFASRDTSSAAPNQKGPLRDFRNRNRRCSRAAVRKPEAMSSRSRCSLRQDDEAPPHWGG